jgi:hypothetical protein
MRHRDYLRRLQQTKKINGLIDIGGVPEQSGDSPAVARALANIMRRTGFSEKQITDRFGDLLREPEQEKAPVRSVG